MRRGATKLHIYEIAAKCGMSPSGVYLIFSGKRGPRLKTAARLATAMGISIDEFMKRLPKQA